MNNRQTQNTNIVTKYFNCDEHSFDFAPDFEDDSDIPNDEKMQV